MTTPIAISLVTSTAARMAAVDALAFSAAIVVAVSVVAVLVASVLFDPSAPRPYHLAAAHTRRVPPLSANQDIPHAA